MPDIGSLAALRAAAVWSDGTVVEPVSVDVLVDRRGMTRYRRLRATERMPVGTKAMP
jgi:hypothetical protein